jgi:hypothetical protein
MNGSQVVLRLLSATHLLPHLYILLRVRYKAVQIASHRCVNDTS